MIESAPAGRRGRRGGGADTRATLLAAAKTVFAELGYDNATVRTIATRAGVDPAMVNHWFGGKQGLFVAAVLELPIRPDDLLARLRDGDQARLGERMVRLFVSIWDSEDGGRMAALMRSVTHQPSAAQGLRGLFVEHLFGPLIESLGVEDAMLRATLCATQMMGLGMIRYVVRFEPLASADVDTLVAAIAPNLQRYLDGDVGSSALGQ